MNKYAATSNCTIAIATEVTVLCLYDEIAYFHHIKFSLELPKHGVLIFLVQSGLIFNKCRCDYAYFI